MDKCPDYLLTEKVRILQLRSQKTMENKKMTWEKVALAAGRKKEHVFAVFKWLKELPWEEVRVLPIEVQMLRSDFLQRKGDDLEKQLTGEVPVKISSGTVCVPAEKMVIEHGLGELPTWVQTELLDGDVLCLVARSNVTDESFELRAETSGPLVQYRAVVDYAVPPDYSGY